MGPRLDGVAEYAWSEARERAIREFGQTPSGALEDEIVEVFKKAPALVVNEIASVAAAFKAGKVHSPWGALRSRLNAPPGGPREIVVSDSSERERAIKRAEGWLRTAGVHFEQEREVLSDLFDDFGERSGPILGRWRDDEELRARLVETWRELRGKAA